MSATPDLPDSGDATATAPPAVVASPAPSKPHAKHHAAWRDLLADIRDGVQWGLTH